MPFGSFASAAKSVLQNGSGAPSGAPSGLPSGTPLKLGDLGNLGGQSADRLGFGGFTAHDIDLIFQNNRDPDLNPRADSGETECGVTSGPPDCGVTSGPTDCGATENPDPGPHDCGVTDSGPTDCGATENPGPPDCGNTGCGQTDACGSTSGSRDFIDQISRIDLLRDQLAMHLQLDSASSMMIR
jgi:hypothetical protein